LAWRIEYADTAKGRLAKLDKPTALRILAYMDERVAGLKDPRRLAKRLSGPLGDLWRFRVGDYRVICEIRRDLLRVLVLRVAHRRDAYRN